MCSDSCSETFSDLETNYSKEADVEVNPTDLQADTFVFAWFMSGTSVKLFVGQILEVLPGKQYKVKSMRISGKTANSFYFPFKDDVIIVPFLDIVRILQPIHKTGATKRQQRLLNFGIDFQHYSNMY